jgi:hypothetical protein
MSKFLIIETRANTHADPAAENCDRIEITKIFGVINCSKHLDKDSSFFEQAQKADQLYAALEKAQKLIDNFCGETYSITINHAAGESDEILENVESEVEYITNEINGYQKEFEEIKNTLTLLL